MTIRVTAGDCRTDLQQHGPFDMLLADPPYGDTSLEWDNWVGGWLNVAAEILKPNGSMWVFGSMRFFQEMASYFRSTGWAYAQDVVWEKHNGSGFQNDRFKRVHEHVVQYYRRGSPWGSVYNDVQTTPDAMARTVRRKLRPPHMGATGEVPYTSVDGGPRIMRSVIPVRSMHGKAIHPTEKPSDLIEILIRTSCPADGIVGDMFAGSGAAGEAAMRAGRRYAGCEIDADMAQKANDRLASLLPITA